MKKAYRTMAFGSILMIAGVAQAGAIKILEFSPVLNGVTANPDVDGVSIINFNAGQGMTAVRVNLSGLQGNTVYRVQVRGAGGFTSVPLETNSAGNLHVNQDVPTDITQGGTIDIHVLVFIDANNDNEPQPSEVRALGCVSGSCTLPLVACSVDADCDDGNSCTDGSCDLGYCAITLVTCPDDGNPCTIEFCNSSSGLCESSPIFGCTP